MQQKEKSDWTYDQLLYVLTAAPSYYVRARFRPVLYYTRMVSQLVIYGVYIQIKGVPLWD